MRSSFGQIVFLIIVLSACTCGVGVAREASFMAPASAVQASPPPSTPVILPSSQSVNAVSAAATAVKSADQAPSTPIVNGQINIEATPDTDLGEIGMKDVKKVTVSFVNRGDAAVMIDRVSVSTNYHINTNVSHDSCTKQTLEQQRSCIVELEVSPKSAGMWSFDVVLFPGSSKVQAHTHLAGKTPELPPEPPKVLQPAKPVEEPKSVEVTKPIEVPKLVENSKPSEVSKPIEVSRPPDALAPATPSIKKDDDLVLSQKTVAPIDFGDVEYGGLKTVQSALMVNDSQEPITISSIEVVAVDKTLVRLPEGCSVNMHLQPQQSCPVVLAWQPTHAGQLSTDLIIRYNGRPGFVVIPVRGVAKNSSSVITVSSRGDDSSQKQSISVAKLQVAETNPKSLPPPKKLKNKTTMYKAAVRKHSVNIVTPDIQKIVSSLPVVSPKSKRNAKEVSHPTMPELHLIGTVGDRAVFLKPDSTTVVAHVGDAIDLGTLQIKIVDVSPQSVDILKENQLETLKLESPAERLPNAAFLSQNDTSSGDVKPTEYALPGSLLLPLPLSPSR